MNIVDNDIMTKLVSKIKYGHEDECDIWIGYRDKKGYGIVWHEGSSKKAHRMVYEVFVGPIPKDMCVLHKCNNGHLGCVKPEHLKIGDKKENARDRALCGRANGQSKYRGSRHWATKITEKQAQKIRDTYPKAGLSMAKIAKKYGVTTMAIFHIIHGKNHMKEGKHDNIRG